MKEEERGRERFAHQEIILANCAQALRSKSKSGVVRYEVLEEIDNIAPDDLRGPTPKGSEDERRGGRCTTSETWAR